jgi:hypothetical protein
LFNIINIFLLSLCIFSLFSSVKGECTQFEHFVAIHNRHENVSGFNFEEKFGIDPQFTPFLSQDNHVYAISEEGYIYCFNQNRAILWKETTHKVDLSSPPRFTPDGKVCFLSQQGDIVYLKPDGSLLAIYLDQGQQFSRPVFDGFGHVYFVSQFGSIHRIDENGTTSFEGNLFGPFSDIAPFPFYTHQNLYWILVGNRKELLNFDSKENIHFGKFTCTFEKNINLESIVLDKDKNTFFVTDSNYLNCIDLLGNLFWEYRPPCSIISPIVIDQEGLIYFGGLDKNLYCVNPKKQSVRTIYLGASASQAPQVGLDGRIFILTDSGFWLWTNDPFDSLWYKNEQIVKNAVQLVTQEKKLPEISFGAKQWEEHFGIVDEEPPLPENIDAILNSTCPFWPDKKVRDTHLLVLIPKRVGGAPLTLNLLQKIIEQPKKGHATKYRYYDSNVKNELGDKQVEKAYWVLMTADVIPGSRNKSYDVQKKLLQDCAKKSSVSYTLPTTLEAATAILMNYVASGKRLYSDSPYTYTRCQEKVYNNQFPAVVGGFGAGGLGVYRNHCDSAACGVGGGRKFGH